MNGVTTLGALTIPFDTAYKASAIGLLATIVGLLVLIAYWLFT